MNTFKLSNTNRRFLGVLGGIAKYYNLDAGVLRLLFILAIIFAVPLYTVGLGLIVHMLIPLYFLIWLVGIFTVGYDTQIS